MSSPTQLFDADEEECNCQFNTPCTVWPFGDLCEHEEQFNNFAIFEIASYVRKRHRYIFRNLNSTGCFEGSIMKQDDKIIPCLIITVPDLNLAQKIPSHVCMGKYSDIIGLDKVPIFIREGNCIPA